LVAVGRKPLWKGMPELIEALNQINQEQYSFVLKVLTQDDLDFSRATFEYEIVKPANDTELAEHYRWGDIFVHSSWFEGFGLPPLEAQACGLAVVATNSGGVCEFLKHKENALIVPPREPRTMAKAVVKLIEDQKLRDRLIKRGLETCQDFTWDRLTDKFESVLLSLVRSR